MRIRPLSRTQLGVQLEISEDLERRRSNQKSVVKRTGKPVENIPTDFLVANAYQQRYCIERFKRNLLCTRINVANQGAMRILDNYLLVKLVQTNLLGT